MTLYPRNDVLFLRRNVNSNVFYYECNPITGSFNFCWLWVCGDGIRTSENCVKCLIKVKLFSDFSVPWLNFRTGEQRGEG